MRAARSGRSARRGILRALPLLGALAIASAGGCAFHSGPANGRAMAMTSELLDAEDWPARETELLEDMIKVTPSSLTLAFPMTVVADGKLTTANWMKQVRVVKSGVYGRGIIRQFQPILKEPGGKIEDIEFEQEEFGGLQFVSFPADANAVRVASNARSDDNPSRYRRYLLRRLGIRSGRDESWYLMRPGTRMRLFEPTRGEPRGIMVHLSSLAGFDYEKPVIDDLCSAGWLILQIDASTARRQESPVDADVSGDMQAPARRLARVIDNRIAEIAYAAEAGVEFLQHSRPKLADRPVVLAGYSAGALVGPSVATLMHDRVDAVVLVGGGANLLNISRRSSLTNGGISVRWTGAVTAPNPAGAAGSAGSPVAEAVWKRLEDAYLSASKLDPYNTAPYLLDKPVLVLHGVFDDIVPADTGDLLYQRLGRPERLVFTLGHRGLFWRLPSQSGTIARWLDEHTPGPGSSLQARRRGSRE